MKASLHKVHCANNGAWKNNHTDMRTPIHFPGFNTRLPA